VPSPSALRSVSWQLPAGRFRLSHVSTLDTPRVEGISDQVSLKVVRMEGWAVDLASARPDAAWDLFLDRYRRLIFAAIRHYAQDYDDVMDVFAQVCAALREGDLRRLPPLRRGIFEHVFLDQCSHIEAYELIHTREAPALSFKTFLGELRATYRTVTDGRRGRVRVELGGTSPAEEAAAASPGDVADTRAQLEQALGALAAARARLAHSSNEWNVHLAPIREAIGVGPSVSRRRQADGLARHFGGGRSP